MAEQRHTEAEVWYEDEDELWWAGCTCSLRFTGGAGETKYGARLRLAEHIRSVTGWAGRVEEDQHGTKVVTVPEGVMPGVEEIEVPEVTPTPDYSITVTRPPHWQGIVIFDGYGDIVAALALIAVLLLYVADLLKEIAHPTPTVPRAQQEERWQYLGRKHAEEKHQRHYVLTNIQMAYNFPRKTPKVIWSKTGVRCTCGYTEGDPR